MRIVRPVVTLTVVFANAALITAATAGVIDAGARRPERVDATASAHTSSDDAAPAARSVPPMESITFDSLPPLPASARPEPGPTTAGQLTQTITVSIVGGDLSLESKGAMIVLTESGRGTFRGEFGPLTVIDARGTLGGWEATVSVTDVTGMSADDVTRIRIRPDRTEVVYGEGRGLRRSPATTVDVGETAPVFFATAGHGGGTYSSGGTFEVRAPAAAGKGVLEVGLVYSVS